MIIPGDTGGDWRARKFVEYAHFVPPVHQAFLLEYAKRRKLTEEQCIFLAFIMGNVYSELTSIFILEEWGYKVPSLEVVNEFLTEWNPKIIYGSARKWTRYGGRAWSTFNWFVNETKNGINPWFNKIAVGTNEREVYDNIIAGALECPGYGRFSTDLFNETLMLYSKAGMITTKLRSDESINFAHGANLTSGLYNIVYMDERADQFDRDGKLTDEEAEFLTEKLLWVKSIYEEMHPEKEIDVPLFVTKVCSFRNCFKGKRGGGFHHYRQLKYLREFELLAPEKKQLWEECYDIRKTVYPSILRGEDHGIVGIPPEINKWWVKHGWVGCEPEALASIRHKSLEGFFV